MWLDFLKEAFRVFQDKGFAIRVFSGKAFGSGVTKFVKT